MCGVGLLGGVLAFGVPAAATGVPGGSASPATNLVDGQIITVTGAGFDVGAEVGVAECLAGAVDSAECDLQGVHFAMTDATGSFTLQYEVTRVINVNGVLTDCALPNACVLGLAESTNPSVPVPVPISFENVPILQPVVGVNPSTDLPDGATVEVSGSGFTPGATIALLECPASGPAVSACDFSTGLFVPADASGSLEVSYRVVRAITSDGTDLDCSVPGTCVLSVGNVDDFDQRSVVAISFATQVTPTPTTPSRAVQPGSSGASGPPTTSTNELAMTGFAPWGLLRFGGGLVVVGLLALSGGLRGRRFRRRPAPGPGGS
jgi:hypothetical protein